MKIKHLSLLGLLAACGAPNAPLAEDVAPITLADFGECDRANNLLYNSAFEAQSPEPTSQTTTAEAPILALPSAAARWYAFNGAPGTVTTAGIIGPGHSALHVTTTMENSGVLQQFLPPGQGPEVGAKMVFVQLLAGKIGVSLGEVGVGGTGNTRFESAGAPGEYFVIAPNGSAPMNQIAILSENGPAGGSERGCAVFRTDAFVGREVAARADTRRDGTFCGKRRGVRRGVGLGLGRARFGESAARWDLRSAHGDRIHERAKLVQCAAWIALFVAFASSARAEEPLEALLEQAKVARTSGQLEKARGLLERAYAQYPAPELLNNIGKVLEELGEYALASNAYAKVVSDGNAPEALRALDRERIAALEPKLNVAWYRVEQSEGLFVEGGSGIIAARSSSIAVELRTARMISRRTIPLERGRVTVISGASIIARDDAACVDLASFKPIVELEIDRKAVLGPYGVLDAICLDPGTHELAVRGQNEARATLALAAKERATLRPAPRAAIDVAKAEEPDRTLVYAVGGAGAAAIIAGIVLEIVAAAERDRVRDAERDASGAITSVGMAEAFHLEGRANRFAIAGAIFAVFGGIAVGSTIVTVARSPK